MKTKAMMIRSLFCLGGNSNALAITVVRKEVTERVIIWRQWILRLPIDQLPIVGLPISKLPIAGLPINELPIERCQYVCCQ